jgi:hypothetical protein
MHKLNGASDDARIRLREWELPEVCVWVRGACVCYWLVGGERRDSECWAWWRGRDMSGVQGTLLPSGLRLAVELCVACPGVCRGLPLNV